MSNINHLLKICVVSINVEMDLFLCCYFVSTANQQAVNTNEASLLTRSMKINQRMDLTTKQRKKFSACQHSLLSLCSFSTSGGQVLGCSSKAHTKLIQVQHSFSLFFAPVCFCCDQEWQSCIVHSLLLSPTVVKNACTYPLQLSPCTYVLMAWFSIHTALTKLSQTMPQRVAQFTQLSWLGLVFLPSTCQLYANQTEMIQVKPSQYAQVNEVFDQPTKADIQHTQKKRQF